MEAELTPEEGVLGIVANSRTLYENMIRRGLNAEMFADGVHRKMFQVMVDARIQKDLNEIYVPGLDLTTGEQSKLLDYAVLTKHEYSDDYFKGMEAAYLERRVRDIFHEFMYTRANCSEAALQIAALAEVGSDVECSLSDMIEHAKAVVEKRSQPQYQSPYNVIEGLDALGQYEEGTLVTLGGTSGHGKSTLALNLTSRWLRSGLGVVYFSNEMRHEYLLLKLACIRSGIYWNKIMHLKHQSIDDHEKKDFLDKLVQLGTQKLWIYERPHSLAEMRLILKMRQPDVFILDTVNALIDTEDRVDIALGKVARELKQIAEQNHSLAIIIAQLKDIDGRPTDKNLVKESRQIRDASDYMDFIYREDERGPRALPELKNILEVYRVKGRLTGIGHCYLSIDLKNGRVGNLEPEKESDLEEFFHKNRRKLFR